MTRATLFDDDVDRQAPAGAGSPAGRIRGPDPVSPKTARSTDAGPPTIRRKRPDRRPRCWTPPRNPLRPTRPVPTRAPPIGPPIDAAGGARPNATDDRAVDFVPDEPRDWTPAERSLITFLEFAGDSIPKSPFHFQPGQFVHAPAVFLAALRTDVSADPTGPRARSGALGATCPASVNCSAAPPSA